MRAGALIPHLSLWLGYGLAVAGLALWSPALALVVAGGILFAAGGLMLRGPR
jgi:hypothetical protein